MTAKTKAIIITLFGLPVLVIGGLAVLGINTPPVPEVTTVVVAPQPPTVAELLILVNTERSKVNVSPLVIDERLNQSAQFKSDDMLTRKYFGHEDPITGDRNGIDMAWKTTQLTCTAVSENLTKNNRAESYNTAKIAVTAWVNSPLHYEAMVDPSYSLTGFGIADGNITEHFCKQ